MSTTSDPLLHTRGGALLTIAWYVVVLLVVFTTAFWLGRTVGPSTTDPGPVAPHSSMDGH
jgi:hypothetical protein